MNHNWIISQLEYNNDEYGGVIIAHWRCETTDEGFHISRYGMETFTPNPEDSNFVLVSDLTEEIVLGWVWNNIDKEDIETSIETEIEGLKNPTVLRGIPWNNNIVEELPAEEIEEELPEEEVEELPAEEIE
jgi:hypothetical protein